MVVFHCPAGTEQGKSEEGRRCLSLCWGRLLLRESGHLLCAACRRLPARAAQHPAAVLRLLRFVLLPRVCLPRSSGRQGKSRVSGPASGPDCTNNQKTSRLALNLLKRAIPFPLRFNPWFVVILFMWSWGKGKGCGAVSLGGVGDAPVRSGGPGACTSVWGGREPGSGPQAGPSPAVACVGLRGQRVQGATGLLVHCVQWERLLCL